VSVDHPAEAAHLRPEATTERLWLDETSWVDVVRGWIERPEQVYDALAEKTAWNQGRIFRYDRWVDEPRLGGSWSIGDPVADPVLVEATRRLQHTYRVRFGGFALQLYRDGRDGQAFHRDRSMRWLDDTVIAVLSLGQQRPWLLRPRANRYAHDLDAKGATHDFHPASGDLLVMGGRCQADWEHSVPQVRHRVGPRISLQWRWTAKTGRPQEGANYNAPRFYSR
jgi:alkylated DNA repair dioxygenase AlkB